MELREVKRLVSLCQFEDELYSNGFLNIAGADEVGRGCLAGPIVAAAVILQRDKIFIEKLNDSKKISKQKRNLIFRKIIKSCSCWSVAKVSPGVIAKVIRDRLMIKMSRIYPEYGFELHKGYGTKKHLKMLREYGPSKIHRLSFKGVLN